MKTLSLIIAALLCLTALCGCADRGASDESVEAPSVDISYGDVSYFIPGGDDSSDKESQTTNSEPSESGDSAAENSANVSQSTESNAPTQQTGGFAIKMAKYDYNNYMEKKHGYFDDGNYKDVSIAILNICNETNKHYSVTIVGKYLDKDGKVLKTETQTWDQFKSGWQKYFLFRPNMQFDRFEYSVETEEYIGDCWKCGFSLSFRKLIKKDTYLPTENEYDLIRGNALGIVMVREIDSPFPICYGVQFLILFDERRQVIGIYQFGGTEMGQESVEATEYVPDYAYFADPNEGGKFEEWPEPFRGNVTGITIITSVDKPKL